MLRDAWNVHIKSTLAVQIFLFPEKLPPQFLKDVKQGSERGLKGEEKEVGPLEWPSPAGACINLLILQRNITILISGTTAKVTSEFYCTSVSCKTNFILSSIDTK